MRILVALLKLPAWPLLRTCRAGSFTLATPRKGSLDDRQQRWTCAADRGAVQTQAGTAARLAPRLPIALHLTDRVSPSTLRYMR
jgi:hypothetical protein